MEVDKIDSPFLTSLLPTAPSPRPLTSHAKMVPHLALLGLGDCSTTALAMRILESETPEFEY